MIKPCCIGDLIMTTPLLDALRRAYPNASITYVAGTWSKAIPEHHPAVDRVIDSGSIGLAGHYSLKDYMKFANQLRSHAFDMAFVLDRSPMVTLLPGLAGIPRRIGPDSLGRGFSLTDRVAVSTSPQRLQHQAELYLDLARAVGLPVDSPHLSFVPTAAERRTVTAPTRLRIALFAGGGSNPGMQMTAKRWPLERYRELAHELLRELDAEILLIGGSDDVQLNQQLRVDLDAFSQRVIDITGQTTLGELGAQLERCDLFIGNDSSPMHLAAAVNIPVLVLFGPTSPQEYGPYPLDDPRHIALWHNPSGRPCFFMGQVRTLDNCDCINAITVDEVWQAAQQLLPTLQRKEVGH